MYNPKMTVWVHGREQELYTIGKAAKLLKRSIETIRLWEKTGIIPKAMYKAGNNVRLYHPAEIAAMQKILRKGKYARKDELKLLMWPALEKVRKKLLEGQNEET